MLLSGGMDSSTCLWWVRAQGCPEVHTVGIDYGQRHRVELEFSARLSAQAGAASHKVLRMDLTQFGGNPLTDAGVAVPRASEGRQVRTVVPYRNMLFLTLAAAHAELLGVSDLYIAAVKDDDRSYGTAGGFSTTVWSGRCPWAGRTTGRCISTRRSRRCGRRRS